MNAGRVYTPPTFIARGIDPRRRLYGDALNIGSVYTPPIFIARGIDHSIGGVGVRHEHWDGVHPWNIHREGYTTLDRGYGGT